MVCSFFLGANTPKGFYSLFSQLDGFDLSVVKGGSGSGKSTLIRSIIDNTTCTGMCEQILCSSDPDSLDGAVFHTLNKAVVDGTAPHIADVKGLGRYIVTPPPVKNTEEYRATLSALKTAKSTAYENAYVSLLGYYNTVKRIVSLIPFDSEHFSRRGEGIIKRETVSKHVSGKTHYRFIDCINHNGFSTLWDTVDKLAKKIYVIDDCYSLADGFFKTLAKGFEACGYDIFICPSPLAPDKIRHIIIPELSLAFVTSDSLSEYSEESYRRIHISSCIDKSKYKTVRQKIRLFEKLSTEFLADAIDSLKSARLAHIEIENIYRPHLDIGAINKIIQTERL